MLTIATESIASDITLAAEAIKQALEQGVEEFCICPSSRNSCLTFLLLKNPHIRQFFWPEERSAAFFALGRSRQLKKPIAIITTSGTAVGELLPAAMEAYYTGVPLLLMTADRPRNFRGTGAPQSAEQKGIFGCYTPFALDIGEEEDFDLSKWDQKAPAHLNLCFSEPKPTKWETIEIRSIQKNEVIKKEHHSPSNCSHVEQFLSESSYPFILLSALKEEEREPVISFLLRLQAPVYIEATSGLREDPRLNSLRLHLAAPVWKSSLESDYPIDAIVRIGGVPTIRLWRDLEESKRDIPVLSITSLPFSGMSRGELVHHSLSFLQQIRVEKREKSLFKKWQETDLKKLQQLQSLFQEEPAAEPSLIYQLSSLIENPSLLYLGNSLPIREWDLAASINQVRSNVQANRGVNGIDGQIATFLGLCATNKENWAIIGDLTALYDLVALWIAPQLQNLSFNIVIVNNGGGKIFDSMFPQKEFQNSHSLNFEHFAAFWKIEYLRWKKIPFQKLSPGRRIIELIPCSHATECFWKRFRE